MYNPLDISRTVTENALVLKQKMNEKLPMLKIPFNMKDRYKIALEFHCIKFLPLPTAFFTLAFTRHSPSRFRFSYNEIQDALKPVGYNEIQDALKPVVMAKSDLDNFKGHLHIDL